MGIINSVRNAMLKTLKIEKVYLIYMDEAKQVHWHLVPRYKKKGIKNLTNSPGKIKDFKLDDEIRKNLKIK